jgi:signal transduction histidine kinase
MSLVNRVSTFFLLALALILVIYSGVLYVFVSRQLHRQFDQQLHAALNQLTAAVEVEHDDVKFEPSDHSIRLGTEDGLEDIRWAVFDEAGLVVALSQNLRPGTGLNDHLLMAARQIQEVEHDSLDLGDWRVLQQRLAAPEPKPVAERDPLERAALVVTVGRSSAELNANLRLLGLLVSVVPFGVWLTAAGLGRWYCATALRPVGSMAAQARAMSESTSKGEVTAERLPLSQSNDELAELGAAFNSLLDAAFQSLTRQRRFTGDAAHQLRTPLAALRGQIEVALRRPRTADEHAGTLSIVLEQVTELQQMIEGLLFLARADGESTLPQAESILLDEWLPKFLQRWQDHPRYFDLHLQCKQPAIVRAPPALVRQLLENLVSNALKYSQPGTPIGVELARSGDSVTIAVVDQGIGVPSAERQAIFEPFYRSCQARQSGAPGTGLGLAIALRIASALGGDLSCEANGDKGSRFVLTLPERDTG